MTVTVSGKNYTQFVPCDATSGEGVTWTTFDAQDTDIYKEGSASIAGTFKSSGNNDGYATLDSGYWDLSGTKHVRLWFLSTQGSLLQTETNNGIQIIIGDGSNTAYYTVGGRDSYPGGWWNIVVDVSAAATSGTKPTDMSQCTVIGVRTVLTGTGKNVDNVWVDNLSVCDGLTVYGDDGGGYFDFEDIYSADNTPATGGWGIITKFAGAYYLTGSIEFGDSASTNSCKFQAKSQVAIFEDRPVNASLYGFDVVDNGTGTTEFILGDKSGTAGIQGCAVRVEDASQTGKFSIDGKTDTDVDNFKLYASTFYGAGAISFAADATNVEVLGCSFESCAQIDPQDCETRQCFFINTSDADAAVLWNESIDIQSCSFIANTTGAGIEMPSAVGSPYTYTNLLFTGNTYDVLNSSGSSITISKTGTTDASSYEGSTVTFVGASVTVKVTCKTASGTVISSATVILIALAKSKGTATTDTTDKLVDTGATFQSDGVAIGDVAFNLTDHTSATVSAVDSETSLSLSSDNFPDGDELYRVGGAFPSFKDNANGVFVSDIVTISNSGTTATVTHNAHGMQNNDKVFIDGGTIEANKGVFSISNVSTNAYDYTMGSSPGSSPTGAIYSTFVPLNGTTDGNGEVSTTRVYSVDQPVEGWGRKSTSSPYYREGPVVDTIDTTDGLNATAVLVSDE